MKNNHPLLEPLDPLNFYSRQKWEEKTVEMIKKAQERTIGLLGESTQSAQREGWWGAIYENGVVAPFGLANYLYELYSRQIWIIDILPDFPDCPRPARQFDEFSVNQLARFREWLKFDYYARIRRVGFHDIEEVDGRHIEQIRKFWTLKNEKIRI